MKEKKSPRWGWIIFWLIVFWPVGLFLMIKKLNDKSALMSGNTKGLSIAGWVLVAFGAIGFWSEISSGTFDASGVVLALVFIAGGVLILRKVKATRIKAEQYRKYLNAIVNVGERNVDNIASAVSVTYDKAKSDIQAMIDEGFLKGAYRHEGEHRVVLAQDTGATQQPASTMPSSVPVQTVSKAVRCGGCGANNVVTAGQVTECEFCGTPISG